MTKWQSNIIIGLLALLLIGMIALMRVGHDIKSSLAADKSSDAEDKSAEQRDQIIESVVSGVAEKLESMVLELKTSLVESFRDSEFVAANHAPMETEAPPEMFSGGSVNSEYLALEGITAQVRQYGDQIRRVRFNLNVVFDGSPDESVRALETMRQGDRLAYITQFAEEVMRTFGYEQIIEPEFPNVYERQFRERFNAENSDMKVHMARPFKWDFN